MTKGKEPKCEECIEPLLKENEEVAMVYSYVKTQVISNVNGEAIDVNMQTLLRLVDHFEVEHDVFDKVVWLFRTLNGK